MANKIITATLHNLTPIPPGSIYRGDGMVEFACKTEPETIKEKLAEYDPDQKIYFKNPSVKVTLFADAEVAKAEKLGKINRTESLIKDFIVEKTAGAIHCAPETQHLFPEPFNHQFQGFEFSLGPAHEDLLP